MSGTPRPSAAEMIRRLGLAPLPAEGGWYRETGQGMGATIAMAAEMGAYTLADRSTWSAHEGRSALPVQVEGSGYCPF